MSWIKGRQGTGYLKKKIWSRFNTDCWLIKYKPSQIIPTHTDPVEGKKHFRLNIVLKGKGVFICEKTILCLFHRIILFRPDKYEHSMINLSKERLVLSIGMVI